MDRSFPSIRPPKEIRNSSSVYERSLYFFRFLPNNFFLLGIRGRRPCINPITGAPFLENGGSSNGTSNGGTPNGSSNGGTPTNGYSNGYSQIFIYTRILNLKIIPVLRYPSPMGCGASVDGDSDSQTSLEEWEKAQRRRSILSDVSDADSENSVTFHKDIQEKALKASGFQVYK
ncbi:uncharacterized protein TNIN_358551 [Trichonephila inaurata madagascariensis]|uniref:Uncharacterized protein n=1 Tax=Trichonephila inaurata madagascariensis TaxID=2747483 RepID=A0A8X6XNP7_9ARAC|nr:uncharacterized protein TNIN_358551 [Trichonephila inaurata madagascariensis]